MTPLPGFSTAQRRKYAFDDWNQPAQVLRYTSRPTPIIWKNAGMPSRTSAVKPHLFRPTIRRALISQNTVSRPIAATKNSEFHFTPTAAPAHTPAAKRHRRRPMLGPHGIGGSTPLFWRAASAILRANTRRA